MGKIATIQEFNDKIFAALGKEMEEKGGQVSWQNVKKHNQEKLGISILFEGTQVATVVYPEDWYEEWKDAEQVSSLAKRIFAELEPQPLEGFRLENYRKEDILKQLRLIMVEEEGKEDFLADIPYERKSGFAFFVRWRLSETMSTIMKTALMEHYEISQEEMFREAKENTKREKLFESLGSRIEREQLDLLGESEVMPFMKEHGPYILTTHDTWYGARLLYHDDILEEIREELQEEFYILPSSLHELLIVPKSESLGLLDYQNMVRDINEEMVDLEERLSNHILEYYQGRVGRAGEMEPAMEAGSNCLEAHSM